MQVAPSFFDSPAHEWADFMPSLQEAGKDPVRPDVTIAFCSLSKPSAVLELPEQKLNLNTFRSCVRTTLLLLGGVECQEKEGKRLPSSRCKGSNGSAQQDSALAFKLATTNMTHDEAFHCAMSSAQMIWGLFTVLRLI